MMGLAENISSWSKDPSSQVGCVIARPDGTIASVGYNGLPRDVDDTVERLSDRAVKYSMTVHAEANAIVHAHQRLDGCTAYTFPFPPCAPCAALLIQAGISRVVSPAPHFGATVRWGDSFMLAMEMFNEAAVKFVTL
jgi:dCMP deaminase